MFKIKKGQIDASALISAALAHAVFILPLYTLLDLVHETVGCSRQLSAIRRTCHEFSLPILPVSLFHERCCIADIALFAVQP